MIKKTLLMLSISAAYFVQAQDVSTIRNTVDIYSNNQISGSSKYQGMAGSMGALGGDFSTLNSNPAGIGVSIASDLSLTLNVESYKNKTSFGGASLDYSKNITDIGNSGGILVFDAGGNSNWKFVNIGVNYSNKSLDSYSETPGNSNLVYPILDDQGNVADNLTFRGHAYNRSGNMSKLSFGVGANYDNRIYLGAGFNFHSADFEQWDTAAFSTQTYNTIDEYHKQDTPFSESSTGFSATVGIIGKVNQNFRLGAAIETPTWWRITRAYNFYDDFQFGDGTGTEDRKISSPMKATLSAAYVANKNFAINVDYTLGITKPHYKVYGNPERYLNDFFDDNYKNLSEIKVGAEYRIADLRIRGGYGFASNPFDSISFNSLNSNGSAQDRTFDNLFIGKRNTLAFGLGYDFKSFYIDAAYQRITSKYDSPFLYGPAPLNSGDYNDGYFSVMNGGNRDYYVINSDAYAVSEVKNTRDNFFITLGWKF